MKGRTIMTGTAEGPALVSHSPISFYGGVDARSGVIIERGHELEGACVSGRVLVFPCGKGSTVGSYVIYGLQRNGAAPLAIVNGETETIIATGTILAGIPCVDGIDIERIATGDLVRVDGAAATVEVMNA